MGKPIKELLQRYKDLIKKDGLSAEKYKWEFLRDYKGKPNFDNDISAEVKSIKFTNLLYHLSVACLKDIAKEFGAELIEEFKSLHDETVDLDERILAYKKNTLKLYRKHGNSKESHHQDERTAAVFLTLKNPEEHTFYKSSYYSKYCEYLGLKVGKPNHKYSHYIELVSELAEDYISKDKELIQLAKGELGDLMNEDPNYLLIAQDILYQIIGNDRDVNYWVFQGNPTVFDFETALREKSLTDFPVRAHWDRIKVGDKVIICLTGVQSGCFALAEVTSEPLETISSIEDQKGFNVDIKITHNLVDNPILKAEILSLNKLQDLKIGNGGYNFYATKVEYETLLEMIKEESDFNRTKTFSMKEAINTILYGPPGTGKTYKLKTDYFPKYTTKETSITPDKHFENVVKDLTWWEVIALALLELKRGKVSEISDSKWVKRKLTYPSQKQ